MLTEGAKRYKEQESIPILCVPPAFVVAGGGKPYPMDTIPPPSQKKYLPRREVRPEIPYPLPPEGTWGQGPGMDLAPEIPYPYPPHPSRTDRRLWKSYIPATTVPGGKNVRCIRTFNIAVNDFDARKSVHVAKCSLPSVPRVILF